MIGTTEWTRTVVAGWQPTIVGDGCGVLFKSADEVEYATTSAVSCLSDLGSNGGWRGQAFDAASARVDGIRRDADAVASSIRILGREIRAGVDAVELSRSAAIAAVVAAEMDGCVVGEDWSVTSLGGNSDASTAHSDAIDARLVDLHRADRDAADAVVQAMQPVIRRESKNFLPLVVGVGLLIEAMVDALIATGVITLGALMFALVDRFGMDAWDTIPDTFFADAGPVDEASVRETVDAAAEPGRQTDYKQVASSREVIDLYETL